MSRFSLITPFAIPLDFTHLLFAVNRVAFPTGKHFGVIEAVNLNLAPEDFIEKYLTTFFVILCLSALKNTVLVRPNQRYLAPLTEKFVLNIQADFVSEPRVRIGEEISVGDVVNEGDRIEDVVTVNFVKELGFDVGVTE